jgi:DNA-directed RNA polymerase specialized sigma24 family protein
VCRRRCARDDEDDVFQEMALLILQSHSSAEAASPDTPNQSCVPLAPLIRRAANKIQDRLKTEQRRKAREVALMYEPPEQEDRTSYWEEIERLGREIGDCIEEATPERRAMLLAFLVKGLPMTLISKLRGVPYRQTRAVLHEEINRLLARFAEAVADLA